MPEQFSQIIRLPYDVTEEVLRKFYYTEFEIDLHGLIYLDALSAVQRIVKFSPRHIRAIYVIHGYHGGTELKKMITKQNLKNSRIKHVNPTFNKGQSVIVFKNIEELK